MSKSDNPISIFRSGGLHNFKDSGKILPLEPERVAKVQDAYIKAENRKKEEERTAEKNRIEAERIAEKAKKREKLMRLFSLVLIIAIVIVIVIYFILPNF